jgi:histone acetyltransferase MYST1
MFEVDGFERKDLLSESSVAHKPWTTQDSYFDVDPSVLRSLFVAGRSWISSSYYHSKEKYSDVGYNLACILTSVPYQRKK